MPRLESSQIIPSARIPSYATIGMVNTIRPTQATYRLHTNRETAEDEVKAILLGIVIAIVAASIVLTPTMLFVWLAGLIACVLLILAARHL